ncbi:GTPase regulator Nrf1 [Termitomyces sp. T159_Od127]|nr:GTPase regulator Nrf1 [Termitomyces sp. T159_Od127]
MSTQPLLQRTANKRIALPVRVEPKVSFANERTFLSWLHFTVVLGGLAVGLLNFGDKLLSDNPMCRPSRYDIVMSQPSGF